MPDPLKLEQWAHLSSDSVITKEVLVPFYIESHLDCSAARPKKCRLFLATLDHCQDNTVTLEPPAHYLSLFLEKKQYPFKG